MEDRPSNSPVLVQEKPLDSPAPTKVLPSGSTNMMEDLHLNSPTLQESLPSDPYIVGASLSLFSSPPRESLNSNKPDLLDTLPKTRDLYLQDGNCTPLSSQPFLGDSDDSIRDVDYSPRESDISSYTSDTDEDLGNNLRAKIHPLKQEKERFHEAPTENLHESNNVEDEITTSKIKNDSQLKKSMRTHIKKNKNFCLYCDSMVFDFARHMFRNHSSEISVQKIIATEKGKRRNELLSALRKKGNFINASAGDIKPVKRLMTSSPSKISSCPYCLGYYARKRLWRHKKSCTKNDGKTVPFTLDRKNLLTKDKRAHLELVSKVFPRMHANFANMTAKTDPLICAYGSKYLKTHRQMHQVPACSRKMRELAMVLIEIKKIDNSIKSLLQALKPENFDNLVVSARNAAGFDDSTGSYRDASFAMNISTALKECCEIAILNAIKKKHTSQGDIFSQVESELNTTILLIKSQWKTEISHQAADHLHAIKMNKISIVPLASDLKILRDYLISEGEKAATTLKKNPTCNKSFKTLVETVYCRVMLLCRKRPGELQRLTVNLYKDTGSTLNSYEEFENTLTPIEAILLKTYKRVVIKGKRKATPVLFSPDVQKLIEVILYVRNNFICESNTFLFTLPGMAHPILGYKVLQKYANLAKCKRPSNITTRSLRKHLATICQLFHMKDEEVEQLSSFMGHSQSTHRSNYRLPDDVYQTAKITKLLLMMEKGEGQQFKGKTLDEIKVNLEDDQISSDHFSDEDYGFPKSPPLEEVLNQKEDNSQKYDMDMIGKKPSQKRKKREVHKWTDEQRKVVAFFFDSEIKAKLAPKKHRVDELYRINQDLNLPKPWEKIKVFVQNIYTNKTGVLKKY